MSTRDVVLKCLCDVTKELTDHAAPSHITDDMKLVRFRLDSLAFGILLGRLEDELGCDPFAESDGVVYPRTVGELVGLYEHHLGPGGSEEPRASD